jgi:hypothetical protein
MTAFNLAFDGAYRESSFLYHPKVPAVVKRSITSGHNVTGGGVPAAERSSLTNGIIQSVTSSLSSSSTTSRSELPVVVNAAELVEQFRQVEHRVLKLGSLYDLRPQFGSNDEQESFDKLSMNAFKRSGYRQL